MGSVSQLGSIGVKAIVLYLLTTAVAISLGLFVGTIFEPGVGINLTDAPPQAVADAPGIVERLIAIVPANPVDALARGEVLSIIFFAILFGVGILKSGDKGRSVGQFFESVADVCLQVTHMVMEFAPLGVFALIASAIGTQGLEMFTGILSLMLCLYLACFLHIVLVYGGLVKLLLKLPVRRFLAAFSTRNWWHTLPLQALQRSRLQFPVPLTI